MQVINKLFLLSYGTWMHQIHLSIGQGSVSPNFPLLILHRQLVTHNLCSVYVSSLTTWFGMLCATSYLPL